MKGTKTMNMGNGFMKNKVLGVIVLAGALSLVFAGRLFAQMNEAEQVERIGKFYKKEIKPIFQKKCFDCHSNYTRYPWYYNVGLGKDIIDDDIREGKIRMDMSRDFPFTLQGSPKRDLELIEHVIKQDSMPPGRYKVMNWGKGLTQKEKNQILDWVAQSKEILQSLESGEMAKASAKEPILPLPTKLDLNPEVVELGRKLFHDPRFARDNTIACARCHDLGLGGTDQKQFSIGVGGQMGDVNSPTVYNSGYNFKQFWDGRVDTLEDQVDGPMHNLKEMGTTWEDLLSKIKDDPYYKEMFPKLYSEGMNSDTIKNAIATFERSLITPHSRFDKYLNGDENAITAEEKEGYKLFKAYGCISCHQGINVGGNLFEKIGVMGDYFADRGTPIVKADYGRYNVTGRERDKFKFKVPTLRNIALTQPYFHDGTVETLEEAVNVMAKYQLGRYLSEDEVQKIVKFLHTLTGEYEGEALDQMQ